MNYYNYLLFAHERSLPRIRQLLYIKYYYYLNHTHVHDKRTDMDIEWAPKGVHGSLPRAQMNIVWMAHSREKLNCCLGTNLIFADTAHQQQQQNKQNERKPRML